MEAEPPATPHNATGGLAKTPATEGQIKTAKTKALNAWARNTEPPEDNDLEAWRPADTTFDKVLHLILASQQTDKTRWIKKLDMVSKHVGPEEMKRLLHHEARVKKGDTKGLPIHVACHYGRPVEVMVWLTKPLHTECVEHGVLPSYSTKNTDGLSPICVAAEAGHTNLLVEMYKGVEIEVGSGDSLKTLTLKSSDDELAHAVRIVARRDDLDSADALYRTDTQAFCRKSANGMLPIHQASQDPAPKDDGVEVLERMLKEEDLFECDLLSVEEAREHVLTKDAEGMLPIHHAAKSGREAVARLLLVALPEEIDTQDHKGNTPFHYACMEGRQARVYVLCTHTHTCLRCVSSHATSPWRDRPWHRSSRTRWTPRSIRRTLMARCGAPPSLSLHPCSLTAVRLTSCRLPKPYSYHGRRRRIW